MQNPREYSYAFYTPLALFCTAIFTTFWIYVQSNYFIDSDLGWLLQCLEKFLAGGAYSTDFYETNPPLSFLVYLPVVPFLHLDAGAIKLALHLIFITYALIANICVVALLKRLGFEKPLITTIFCALVFAQTWGTGFFCLSKDYLILCFLPALSLAQYQITTQHPKPNLLLIFACVLGGIAICLKPHYGIIAAGFFIHRLIKTKKISSVLCSIDFITLLICGITYLVFTQLFFPDFLSVVLPEVSSMYMELSALDPFEQLIYIFLSAYSLIILQFIKNGTPYKKDVKFFIYGLNILGFACIAAFLLQGKGYSYQATPFLSLFITALFIAIATLISYYHKRQYLCIWATYAILCAFFSPITFEQENFKLISHDQYAKMPLITTLKEKSPNSTYTIYGLKATYLAAPYYLKMKNGSRFGQFWPLEALNIKFNNAITDEERDAVKKEMNHYIDMLAQDIKTHTPGIILVPQYPDDNMVQTQKFLKFLKANEQFSNAFTAYHYAGNVAYDDGSIIKKKKKNPLAYIYFDIFVLNDTEKENEAP